MDAPHSRVEAEGATVDAEPTAPVPPASAPTVPSAQPHPLQIHVAPPSSAPPPRVVGKLSPSDFLPSVLLGEGSYSQVYLVQSREDGRRYAMKVLSKAHLHRHQRSGVALAEKAALSVCCHPNVVRLFHTFQDPSSLYFILELCEMGDVLHEVEELGGYPIDVVRFYAAQLLWALHYLHHTARILHRDVKPENLLLNAQRHVKLADFGAAKMLTAPLHTSSATTTSPPSPSALLAPAPALAKKHSFVGTAAYVAPEMLREGDIGFGVDQWSAGCTIYQMITNSTPFHAPSEYLTFQRILQGELAIDPTVDADAADLIRRLMRIDSTARLGSKEEDWAEVERHPFFAQHVDWQRIKEGTAQCPPLPSVKGKKFSLVSEDSMLGWSSQAPGGDWRSADGDDALEEVVGDDEGVEERARGEILTDLTSGKDGDGDGNYRSGLGQAKLSDSEVRREVEVQTSEAATDASHHPPRAEQPSIALSHTFDTISPSPSTSAAVVAQTSLQPNESILLSSSVRTATSSPHSLLSTCLPCLSRPSSPPAPPHPSSSPSPSSSLLLLLTSAGRALLVDAVDDGAAERDHVKAGEVVSQWKVGKAKGEAMVKRRGGGATDGKGELLRLIDAQGGVREWKVVSGATASQWVSAVEHAQVATG